MVVRSARRANVLYSVMFKYVILSAEPLLVSGNAEQSLLDSREHERII